MWHSYSSGLVISVLFCLKIWPCLFLSLRLAVVFPLICHNIISVPHVLKNVFLASPYWDLPGVVECSVTLKYASHSGIKFRRLLIFMKLLSNLEKSSIFSSSILNTSQSPIAIGCSFFYSCNLSWCLSLRPLLHSNVRVTNVITQSETFFAL